MYITKKTFIKPDMEITGLLYENPSLLLMLEHFDIDFVVGDKTVAEVCRDHHISTSLFITFANMYNGFSTYDLRDFKPGDAAVMIRFLKNSHDYYKEEKYPEVKQWIEKLLHKNDTAEMRLVDKFFSQYFQEVNDHLDYEDQVAFPYFSSLINENGGHVSSSDFSASVYRDHHTDIESKLMELKNLLLKHITLKNDRSLRRQLLWSLFQLEHDLHIHYLIEEHILIPLIKETEKARE